MSRLPLLSVLCVTAALVGCSHPSTNNRGSKTEPAQVERVQPVNTQNTKSISAFLSNDRLKRHEIEAYPIVGDNNFRVIDGVWVPESNDPSKAMVFPEQVKISCTNSNKTCQELKITLGVTQGLVEVMSIDETDWPITLWDTHGLLASYGPDTSPTAAASDRCHSHILSMTFDSGAVSISDIPTHEKGCAMFTETNSYRLARGYYYVDTSPGNDMDKRK